MHCIDLTPTIPSAAYDAKAHLDLTHGSSRRGPHSPVVGDRLGQSPVTRSHPEDWETHSVWRNFAIIHRRVGLPQWEDAFEVMRTNCETDWAQEHPQDAVSTWIGNDMQISTRHYLQIPEGLYANAAASKETQNLPQQLLQTTPSDASREAGKTVSINSVNSYANRGDRIRTYGLLLPKQAL